MKRLSYKTATLGFLPSLISNALLLSALTPGDIGSNDEGTYGLYALRAVIISHPLEVARVLIVNNESGDVVSTLRALYNAEGIAGLYRGFIPRAMFLTPTLMTMNYMIRFKQNNIDSQEPIVPAINMPTV